MVMMMVLPVPVVFMMLMVPMFVLFVMPVAVLAGLFVMMVMIFVYHGIAFFLDAKIHAPPCNRVAIFARIGYLASPKRKDHA